MVAARQKDAKLEGFPQVTMGADGSIHIDATSPKGSVDVVQKPGAKNQEGSLVETKTDAKGHTISGTTIGEGATVSPLAAAVVAAAVAGAAKHLPVVEGVKHGQANK